ncbi:ribonuclease P Rpr2/Rpp21/SNM1 subunit [Sporobolomyces salmoneus]|uniref:ribonuclease P Rpr2/Rpp21/SNM1 subunit n=1 Tax=Sporobolomyces salmoneus TaxID=183962 RepID=UPI003171FC4C
MAKKAGRGVAEPTGSTSVPSRDALQRLSYLYQASALLNNITGFEASSRPKKRRKIVTKNQGEAIAQVKGGLGAQEKEGDQDQDEGRKVVKRASQAQDGLVDKVAVARETSASSGRPGEERLRPISRHLVRTMQDVAKKATLRMDPAVKRTVCKGCDSVLVPGISSSVRIKPSGPHAHLVVHTCANCLAQRRLPAPPLLPEPEPDQALDTAQVPQASKVTAPPKAGRSKEEKRSKSKMTKRERREKKQARKPIFLERKGHVVVKGDTVLRHDEYGDER